MKIFSAQVVLVGQADAVSPLLSFVKLTVFFLVGSAHGFQLLMKRIFCQLYNSWRWFLERDYNARFSKCRILKETSQFRRVFDLHSLFTGPLASIEHHV